MWVVYLSSNFHSKKKKIISMFEISVRMWTFQPLWIIYYIWNGLSKTPLIGAVLMLAFVLFILLVRKMIPLSHFSPSVTSVPLPLRSRSVPGGSGNEQTTKVRYCLRNSVEHLVHSITTRKFCSQLHDCTFWIPHSGKLEEAWGGNWMRPPRLSVAPGQTFQR